MLWQWTIETAAQRQQNCEPYHFEPLPIQFLLADTDAVSIISLREKEAVQKKRLQSKILQM